MRARVVDTSLLVAVANPSDVHHEEARKLLSDPGPALIPNEVLIETVGLMSHRTGRKQAKAFVAALRQVEGIELGHETDMAAALSLLDNFADLSIVDACAVTLAWRLGAGLDTFDEAQRKAWASR